MAVTDVPAKTMVAFPGDTSSVPLTTGNAQTSPPDAARSAATVPSCRNAAAIGPVKFTVDVTVVPESKPAAGMAIDDGEGDDRPEADTEGE